MLSNVSLVRYCHCSGPFTVCNDQDFRKLSSLSDVVETVRQVGASRASILQI